MFGDRGDAGHEIAVRTLYFGVGFDEEWRGQLCEILVGT